MPAALTLNMALTLQFGVGINPNAIIMSPTGNDSNPGTLAAPVLTGAQAQVLGQALGTPYTVYARGAQFGNFNWANQLTLTAADDGCTWATYPPDVAGGNYQNSAQLDMTEMTFTYVPGATFAVTDFTGSISGLTLTKTAGPTLFRGQIIKGAGITPGTQIQSGSGSSYQLNISQTVGSEAMTATSGGDNWAILIYGGSYITLNGLCAQNGPGGGFACGGGATAQFQYNATTVPSNCSISACIAHNLRAGLEVGSTFTLGDSQSGAVVMGYIDNGAGAAGTQLTIKSFVSGALSPAVANSLPFSLSGTGITSGTTLTWGPSSGSTWTVNTSQLAGSSASPIEITILGLGEEFAGIVGFNDYPSLQVTNFYIHDMLSAGVRFLSSSASGVGHSNAFAGDGFVDNTNLGGGTDSAGMYTQDESGLNTGVEFDNCYIRDPAGRTPTTAQLTFGGVRGIYADDGTSNFKVRRCIVVGTCAVAFFYGQGTNSGQTYNGNLQDMGAGGATTAIALNQSSGGGNTFNGDIILSSYSGNGEPPGATTQYQSSTGGVAIASIANNVYFNYSTGAYNTTGTAGIGSDTNPITGINPQISGYTYVIASGSVAFASPTSFVDFDRSWGPPGFVIPALSGVATQPSCPH